ASVPVADPYVRIDNTSSDVDHQIFLLYQQSQLPVLYSDTLSKSPLTILNPNYQIAGFNTSYIIKYLKKKADILTGVTFVRDKLLPPLGTKIKLHSVLLIDTLMTSQYYSATYSVVTYFNVYQGISALGIANIPRISTMSSTQLQAYKADIFTTLLLGPLNSGDILKNFNLVSAAYYNKYYYAGVTAAGYLTSADKTVYGFIPDGKETASYYASVDQTTDLKLFLSKILTLSDTDFKAQYGSYPLIMSKYSLLKTALTATGFDLTKI
ncbi:MAG TPA: hypothetical protein VGC08_13710, partial [Pedobacter sp.]